MLLEENEAGDANWRMTASTPQSVALESASTDGVPAIINFAELSNIRITRRRPGFDDRVALLTRLDLKTNDENFIVAQGSGQIDANAMNLSATVGPVDHLASAGGLEYWLVAELGVADIKITGRTGDSAAGEQSQLEGLITSAEVSALLEMFEISADISGPLRVESMMTEEEGEPVLRLQASIGDINAQGSARMDQNRIDFAATIAPLRRVGDAFQIPGLPDAELVVQGGVSNNRDSYELHDVSVGIQTVEAQIDGVIGKSRSTANKINISVAAPSLQDLHSELPEIPLAATVTAVLAGDGIAAEQFEITFGDSDVSGELELQFSEPVSVAGSVRSKLLDLTKFSANVENGNDEISTAETEAETDPEATCRRVGFQ